MEYGTDHFYTDLMSRCFDGWKTWNDRWDRPLYHEDGILVMCREAMQSPGFEGDSYAVLAERGDRPERLDEAEIRRRFGSWRGHTDGYFNPKAGWAESGAVTAKLHAEAELAGVVFERAVTIGVLGDERVTGVWTDRGSIEADLVVMSVGAWTPTLLPELADRLRAMGQPVLHFGVDPQVFHAGAFPPWAADIANTGWYGFPAKVDGTLKVANHGAGIHADPMQPRVVPPEWEARFREFFREHVPALADAPVVGSRLCLYCDSFDGDFFICRHPDRDGLVLNTGGSGHGFKFAPILGDLAADAALGVENPDLDRFAWRVLGARHTEDARHDPTLRTERR